jgi:hypothetical protein
MNTMFLSARSIFRVILCGIRLYQIGRIEYILAKKQHPVTVTIARLVVSFLGYALAAFAYYNILLHTGTDYVLAAYVAVVVIAIVAVGALILRRSGQLEDREFAARRAASRPQARRWDEARGRYL